MDWVCADVYPGPGPTLIRGRRPALPGLGGAAPQARHDRRVRSTADLRPAARAQWLRAAEQTVVSHRQIKALVYFDSNMTGTSLHTSFALDAGTLAAFREIADNRYFNPLGVPVSGH